MWCSTRKSINKWPFWSIAIIRLVYDFLSFETISLAEKMTAIIADNSHCNETTWAPLKFLGNPQILPPGISVSLIKILWVHLYIRNSSCVHNHCLSFPFSYLLSFPYSYLLFKYCSCSLIVSFMCFFSYDSWKEKQWSCEGTKGPQKKTPMFSLQSIC